MPQNLQDQIEKTLGNLPYIFRTNNPIRKSLDGLSDGFMANNDAEFPLDKLLVGRRVAYTRDSYIAWLLSRIQTVEKSS